MQVATSALPNVGGWATNRSLPLVPGTRAAEALRGQAAASAWTAATRTQSDPTEEGRRDFTKATLDGSPIKKQPGRSRAAN